MMSSVTDSLNEPNAISRSTNSSERSSGRRRGSGNLQHLQGKVREMVEARLAQSDDHWFKGKFLSLKLASTSIPRVFHNKTANFYFIVQRMRWPCDRWLEKETEWMLSFCAIPVSVPKMSFTRSRLPRLRSFASVRVPAPLSLASFPLFDSIFNQVTQAAYVANL